MPRAAAAGQGRHHPSQAESSFAGLSSPDYKDRVRHRLQGLAADKHPGLLLLSGHRYVWGERTSVSVPECVAVHTSHCPVGSALGTYARLYLLQHLGNSENKKSNGRLW